jgi:type IV pilus assembly protein PilY1
MNSRSPSKFRRALAGMLAFLIAHGPVAPAYAALTQLADQPLNINTSAKPNIVLTVDDSTSMLFDYLPDYVVTSLFCRGGTGAATAQCGWLGSANDYTLVGGGKYYTPGYIYQQYNAPYQSFSASYGKSGPGAGCFGGSPPTCTEGVDPGALPGIGSYPAGPQPSWPNANKPYEYWLFWPAPAHNAAINALYYDPLITYQPPVDSTGASYPQMNAANTVTWTKVPIDPWASPVAYADLTATVNIGKWCNSDWSIGRENNTDTCRVNGSNAAAFSSVPAADGADYTYPWAPPGFKIAPSPAPSTASTYAAQKVTLDPTTLKGTAVTAAWANAKNEKYFYENENVIWCDVTSPSWPQTGPTVAQKCENYQAQTCSVFAGACVNKTAGACNNPAPPTCSGANIGTCSGYQPAQCNGSAGVCNNYIPASCGYPGKCVGSSAQTCNGTIQTCDTTPQTCSGPFAQTCNLPGTQTCQPQQCTVTYDPPGCELLPPGPENQCKAISNCPPPICTPDPGKCTYSGASCTSNAQCPTMAGACNLNGKSCMSGADCVPIGLCSIQKNVCTQASDCKIVSGSCSKTGQVCDNIGQCPAWGNCQVGGAVCLKDSDCPGTCAKPSGTACYNASVCQDTKGLCSDGTTVCTSSGNCPLTGGTCTIKTCQNGAVCSSNAQCKNIGDEQCKTRSCTLSSQCQQVMGSCQGGPSPGAACSTNSQCLAYGTCSNGKGSCSVNTDCGYGTCSDGSTSCTKNGDCPNAGKCNTNGQACNNDNQCPPSNGVCSMTNQACKTPGVDLTNCPNVGTCSVTKGFCTSDSSCPAQPGPLPPSAATCSTGGVGGNSLATLRNDAENNGVVCRRNNKTSGTYTSGAFDYPSGNFITPITGGTGADACTVTNHWQPVPRHYWKVSVEWCDKQIATAGDKWLNYGTPTGGSCQSFRDGSHIYPRFYQFGGAAGDDNYSTAAFTRVDLDISKRLTAVYDHGVDGDGNPIKRSFDEEMTNYANWFAYYRTRIQAVKTVTSLAFTELDDTFRVGLHTLSNGVATSAGEADPSKFVNVKDFLPAQKKAWWDELFAIKIPLQQETPNLDAMMRIGEYFKNGSSGSLSGATDPIILSCQKNWHMLFTDGFTNQPALPAVVVGNQDDTIPVYPDYATTPIPGLVPGQPWPSFFREDPLGSATNAASDYAMYYWVTDLRTSGPLQANDVPSSLVDPAAWQHLNFAAMSLGTQGKLPAGNQSVTETQIATGAVKWPQPYPKVYRPDASGVDDLWHAAINGRGRFVNADSADELKLGMGQILQDITNQAGARAGAGFQSSVITGTTKWIYRARFEPGWSGSLAKIQVDPTTGSQIAIEWEASTQLGTQLLPTAQDPQPWFTKRNIVTMNGGTPVAFRWANLSATQQNSLAPGKPTKAQRVLSFLRGDATYEGTKLGQLRVRAKGAVGENFLGDIVNARPVYVGPPKAPYVDVNDPGYSSFASTYSARKAMVYAAANDGMLHAFNDSTGDEAWAYIPEPLYRANNTGLGALAYQDGALPPFRHKFYVDSTPRVVDVRTTSGSWRSLLVAGLGKGGRSYYALNVTDPGAVKDEATAANNVLWEFTNADLGYTYGQPIITKTHAFGGRWVVIVPAGYNNASGEGKIFIIDAEDGSLLKTMSTGFGSATSPAGLAHIAGYTKDYRNQLVEQIYGGDLYGHFWRFDVSNGDDSKWTVDEIAYLTDASGIGQPITIPPQIEIDLSNGIDRWVFIGTGRLLHESDLKDSQQQTLYAIRDGTGTAPRAFPTRLEPRTDPKVSGLEPLTDKLNGLSSKPVNGWYDDLPAGQDIVTPIQAAISVVGYIGTSPQTDPCLTGQPATLYVREFSLGNTLLLDSGGSEVESLYSASGAVGLEIVSFGDNATSTGTADIRVAITLGTTGEVKFFKVKLPNILAAHRMSWRLLGQ